MSMKAELIDDRCVRQVPSLAPNEAAHPTSPPDFPCTHILRTGQFETTFCHVDKAEMRIGWHPSKASFAYNRVARISAHSRLSADGQVKSARCYSSTSKIVTGESGRQCTLGKMSSTFTWTHVHSFISQRKVAINTALYALG